MANINDLTLTAKALTKLAAEVGSKATQSALEALAERVATLEEQGGGGSLTEAEVKGWINEAVGGLVDGAPTALDTLKELADALQNSETELGALVTQIASKASQADFTVHTSDTTAHVTGAERTAWNGKADAASTTITDAEVKTLVEAIANQ